MSARANRPRRGRKRWGLAKDLIENLRLSHHLLTLSEEERTMLETTVIHTGNLGRTAGYALYPDVVELHQGLMKEGREKDLGDTLLHELGHILDHKRRGRSDHSAAWKKVMADLGAPGEERCHDYAYVRRSRRSRIFVYACTDCGYEYHRGRRFYHDAKLYRHPRCKDEANQGVLKATREYFRCD